jgi:hypothetical protein
MLIEEQYLVDDKLEDIDINNNDDYGTNDDNDINNANIKDPNPLNLQSFLKHLNLKSKEVILAACCSCKEELTIRGLAYITFPTEILNLFISHSWNSGMFIIFISLFLLIVYIILINYLSI